MRVNRGKKIDISKTNIANIKTRKIPQHILKTTLEKVNNTNDLVWLDKNNTCNELIHKYSDYDNVPLVHSNLDSYKLKLARICLLRRDWHNLERILRITNSYGTRTNRLLFPTCIRYSTLRLLHSRNSELTSLFLNACIADGTTVQDVLKRCTSYVNTPPADEETDDSEVELPDVTRKRRRQTRLPQTVENQSKKKKRQKEIQQPKSSMPAVAKTNGTQDVELSSRRQVFFGKFKD